MTCVWTTGSPEETEAAGARVGRRLRRRDVVALHGELGAGKTTFVRGVHAALGARGRPRSPSYTTLNVYGGEVPIYHFDLFRYEAAGPAFLDEFSEWLEADAVVLIEWAERLGPWIPGTRLDIDFEGAGAGRTLTLTPHGPTWTARVDAWERTS